MSILRGALPALQHMFEENSRMLKETTQKTNDLLGKPGLQMESVDRAMTDLFTVIDLYEQSNRSIIQSASEQTKRLSEINSKVHNRLGLMPANQPNNQLPTSESVSNSIFD